MNKIKLILVFLFSSISCYAQITTEEFENYHLLDVGYISIPTNMEVQSGKYKKIVETFKKEFGKKIGYEISDNRVVFQQKGLNDFNKSSLTSYVRVMFETVIGNISDYEKITKKFSLTPNEISELNTQFKNQIENSFAGTGLKLIDWYGVSIVTINNRTALKINYLRQLNDKPSVYVEIFRFQNNDRMHSLTLSYRQSESATWKPLYKKILDSFTITNIR